MRKLLLLLLIVAVVLPNMGCSKRFTRYVGSFGAAGAAVGAGVGGVTSTAALTVGEGAGIGAGVGGLTGAIVADNFDDTDWDGMEAEIARLNSTNDDLRLANAAKDGLIAERDALLAMLENNSGDLQSQIAEAEQRLADLQGQLAIAQQDADRYSADYIALEGQLVANESELEAQRQAMQDLQDRLGQGIEVGRQGAGITLTILDELLFSLGSADLTESGHDVLSRAADTIRELYPANSLLIEGHTDDLPITKSHWTSNWELGSARSLSVLHHMIDREAFAPTRLSAVSYGSTRPAVPNSSDEFRTQNRRAVIVILPEEGTAVDAAAPGAESVVFNFADTAQ